MNQRHVGTWHFVIYDDEVAKLLIKFCDSEHVRLYAYAKHTRACNKPHWHFVFLFYRPITLYHIVCLSGVCLDDPQTFKGAFDAHLRYLITESLTNFESIVITNSRINAI